MGKFARSWELGKQSLAVLRADKQLVVFPILSVLAAAAVLVSFALPLIFLVDWSAVGQALQQNKSAGSSNREAVASATQWWHYLVAFAFYFANFFVMTFFNSALIACAIRKFNGESATVGDGLRAASSRIGQIAAWSALAATVGVLLNALQERLGVVGKVIVNLIGMAWTIATFFVVPVLVVEGVGPFDAVKRSVEVLKKTWGETLISNLGVGALSFALLLPAILLAIGGVVLAVVTEHFWIALAGLAVLLVWGFLVTLVSTTLRGILLAATYLYASTGRIAPGFEQSVLLTAFTPKKSK